MRQVQLQDAEEHFAALVAEAEAGESLTIVRDGKAVAQIIPFPEKSDELSDRDAAIRELDLLLRQGLDLGGVAPTRDEMHDGR
jgi:prevent-host-death family protein